MHFHLVSFHFHYHRLNSPNPPPPPPILRQDFDRCIKIQNTSYCVTYTPRRKETKQKQSSMAYNDGSQVVLKVGGWPLFGKRAHNQFTGTMAKNIPNDNNSDRILL